MTQPSNSQKSTSRRAFNLVEMIITSLLVGVIAIGVIPLFTRAISNNIYGADASQLASFLRSGTERVQQVSANDPILGLDTNPLPADPTEGSNNQADPDDWIYTDTMTLRSVPVYFDSGPRDNNTKADQTLGDESWKAADVTPTGIFLWRQRREIREFSVADVFRGNISVTSGAGAATLSPLGNPKLFDSPQPLTGKADIREIRMIVESTKGSIDNTVAATPSGIKQKAIVKIYRAF